MLKFLTIRDFVIVDSLELECTSGFTALTGETGAGKSILIDALALALGERGEPGMIRAGCERAEISAEFDVAAQAMVQAWLHEQALEGDAGVCLMRRVLDHGGRSRGFINGRSVTLQQMREVGSLLLDIHGQHAHQSLLRGDAQREMLDDYAKLLPLRTEVAQRYGEWQALRQRRARLMQNAEAVAAERELLNFQKRELDALGYNAQEWSSLQSDHARLSNATTLLETAQQGVEALSEAESACLPQIAVVLARVREGAALDPALRDIQTMLESAQNELQEAVYALRHYQQKLDVDPELLREQEQRIADIVAMARKYRVAAEQLPEVLQAVHARLSELGAEGDLSALQQQEEQAEKRYWECAMQLRAGRERAAEKLAQDITAAMQTLAMQGGRFAVALLPLEEGGQYGAESVEFQVAANPGTPLRGLAKVASGGELSRISLAIQVSSMAAASVPTLIFDEVDSGIGGRVAEIVGKLLRQLGQRHQVMCVTHLPQVAAKADVQWQVSKSVKDGVTLSGICVLSPEQRIEEVARMLGGETMTETTRKHAAEMLEQS